MTLGDLIGSLEATRPDLFVRMPDGRPAGYLHSYRGYYDQLALGPCNELLTAGEILTRAKAADGAVFEGYKGGQYSMDRYTAVWLAEYGHSSGIALTGFKVEGDTLKLVGHDISEYA